MRSTKEKLRYDHVLLKSDYWKKFAGTATKQGLCKNPPKQSVETHSAWSLLPPKDAEGVDWANMPVDHQHIEADSTGFRGYVVEFYNVISDIVVQDGYQSVKTLSLSEYWRISLAEQAERFDDMVLYLDQVVQLKNEDFTTEERNLLSVGFKN